MTDFTTTELPIPGSPAGGAIRNRPDAVAADVRALRNDPRLGGRVFRSGEIGRVGPYRLRQVLGVGGTGVAFLADRESGRARPLVCLKVLRPSLAGRWTSASRFESEVESLRRVDHPNVAALLDRGAVPPGRDLPPLPFAVMTCARGAPLDRVVARSGPLGAGEAAYVAAEAALGLAAVHRAGLVHRDLKPANLVYDRATGAVTVVDLGLACDPAESACLGPVAGTPAFMAPEQVNGRALDARSDLFVLGAVLHATLSGRPPFGGGSPLEVMARVAAADPAPLSALRPGLPPGLLALVASLLEKDPAARPPSADEAARRLRPFAITRPAPARKAATVTAPTVAHLRLATA